MKKLFLLMLPLAALSFVACDKGDDDNGGGVTKLVKTLTYEWSDSDPGEAPDVHTFTYDSNNRISKVVHDDGGYWSYTYANNTVTETWNRDNDNIYTTTYFLDANGYALKAKDSDGNVTNFQYDGGYISTEMRNSENSSFSCVYTWSGGNLTKMVTTYTSGSSGQSSDTETHTVTYSDKKNKLNLDIFDVFSEWEGGVFIFKGFQPTNLPSKTEYNDGTDIGVWEYQFDSDGYPTKIIDTHSEHGETNTETITITYY